MNTKKDLGIVSITMQNNKTTTNLIKVAHEYFDNHPYNQVCFFTTNCDIIQNIMMPVLHVGHAKFFSGNILVTDLQSLELALSFINIYKIIFFATDIPWTTNKKYYKYWENIFLDDRTNIIANNEYLYDLFSICYKKPNIISERLSYEEIAKCL